jgi:rhamnogalacturonan acetylesterase
MGRINRWLWPCALVLSCLVHGVTPAQLYLCGDSTMAKGNQVVDGWGEHIQPFVSIPVHNRAIGGRSARSFTSEGRFEAVAKLVQPGDTVVIEFGRNDGGIPQNDSTKSYPPCPGASTETCEIYNKGQKEIIVTFPVYLANAGKAMTAKGAKVIFSSMTPHNIWWVRQGGKQNLNPAPPKFVEYAKLAASMVGPGASYVDHWTATVEAYKKMGKTKADSYFPRDGDPVHTNAVGGTAVAQSFLDAVRKAGDPFSRYIKESAQKA